MQFALAGGYYRCPAARKFMVNLYKPEPCRLVRDPDNKHDPDAIKVMVDGDLHIGYVPKHQTDLFKEFSEGLVCPLNCMYSIYQPVVKVLKE
jgi:hypothetical protein